MKFGDFIRGWMLVPNAKFQHNITKIMAARPKNIWAVNTLLKSLFILNMFGQYNVSLKTTEKRHGAFCQLLILYMTF